MIVVNWNGAECLPRCIESVLNQNYSPKEVIVVDNASTDGSPKMVSERYPKVRLIESSVNLGFSAACNLGARAASGQILVFFNNDAVMSPGSVEALAAPLQSLERVGVTGGIVTYRDGTLVWNKGGRFDCFTGTNWHIDQGKYLDAGVQADLDYVPGAMLAVRREIFDLVGGLDEALFLYGDDLDLCLTVSRMGLALIIVPNALAVHLVSFSRRTTSTRWVFYLKTRGQFYVICKQLPAPLALSALFVQMTVLMLFESITIGPATSLAADKFRALLWVLGKRRRIAEARQRLRSLGGLRPRIRLREFAQLAVNRILMRGYYW